MGEKFLNLDLVMTIVEYLDKLTFDYAQACLRPRGKGVYYIASGKKCRIGIPVSKKSGTKGRKSKKGGSKRSTKGGPSSKRFNRHLPRIRTSDSILNKVPESIKRKNKKLSEEIIKEREREVKRLKQNFNRYMELHRERLIESYSGNK